MGNSSVRESTMAEPDDGVETQSTHHYTTKKKKYPVRLSLGRVEVVDSPYCTGGLMFRVKRKQKHEENIRRYSYRVYTYPLVAKVPVTGQCNTAVLYSSVVMLPKEKEREYKPKSSAESTDARDKLLDYFNGYKDNIAVKSDDGTDASVEILYRKSAELEQKDPVPSDDEHSKPRRTEHNTSGSSTMNEKSSDSQGINPTGDKTTGTMRASNEESSSGTEVEKTNLSSKKNNNAPHKTVIDATFDEDKGIYVKVGHQNTSKHKKGKINMGTDLKTTRHPISRKDSYPDMIAADSDLKSLTSTKDEKKRRSKNLGNHDILVRVGGGWMKQEHHRRRNISRRHISPEICVFSPKDREKCLTFLTDQ